MKDIPPFYLPARDYLAGRIPGPCSTGSSYYLTALPAHDGGQLGIKAVILLEEETERLAGCPSHPKRRKKH
jgi:hypothetical protein